MLWGQITASALCAILFIEECLPTLKYCEYIENYWKSSSLIQQHDSKGKIKHWFLWVCVCVCLNVCINRSWVYWANWFQFVKIVNNRFCIAHIALLSNRIYKKINKSQNDSQWRKYRERYIYLSNETEIKCSIILISVWTN